MYVCMEGDLLLASEQVLGPELQVTAIALRPVWIQVDEHVHPPVHVVSRVAVEIRVDVQVPARHGLVDARPSIMRVRNQIFYACSTYIYTSHIKSYHAYKDAYVHTYVYTYTNILKTHVQTYSRTYLHTHNYEYHYVENVFMYVCTYV